MTILIDMNLNTLWVEYLRTHGIESTHWSSVGRADAFDHEIMNFAVAHNMVVLTHDLGSGALLAVRRTRQPSVVHDTRFAAGSGSSRIV
jgi:predicted nuclease of predicted toxin-antitoxin system